MELAQALARWRPRRPTLLILDDPRIEAGGRVEADHIVGYMVDKAKVAGVDDTLFRVAYTHLKAYENRRAAGRL